MGAVLPGWWRGFVGEGGRCGRQAVQRPLAEAVLSARVPVGNAAVALTEMDKLLPRLTPACAETVLGGFVGSRRRTGWPRSARCAAGHRRYGRWGEFQRREDLLKHRRSLSQPYADDGMAEYRLRLDPRARPCSRRSSGRWPRRNRRR